ncbi:MAG TPA: translation initiation factor IF-3, partial [Bacteroidales bacterium]|nr:translation initiation factor IF-3 [Bacteroidales bacterium]
MATPFKRPRGGGYVPKKRKEDPHRINQGITTPVVRVVGDNVEQGIFNLREALEIARSQNLDLVEISPTANPPVCKVIDYRKFLYDLKKKQKEIKAKSAKV